MNVNKNVLVAGASAASLAVGSVAGYFFAKKRIENLANKRVEEEIEGVKQMYRARYKDGEYATPETAQLHIFKEAAQSLGYSEGEATDESIHAAQPVSPAVTIVDMPELLKSLRVNPNEAVQYNKAYNKNIWQEQEAAAEAAEAEPPSDSDWTWDKELDWRDRLIREGKPYVISAHEFFSNDPEHEQIQVTFYQGDNALVTEENELVLDINGSINQDNLLRFGSWSNDENMVYVRNDEVEIDYEIKFSELNYAVDILDLPQPAVPKTPARSRF